MEKVRPRCGEPSDRGRLKNRTEHFSFDTITLPVTWRHLSNAVKLISNCFLPEQRMLAQYQLLYDPVSACLSVTSRSFSETFKRIKLEFWLRGFLGLFISS